MSQQIRNPRTLLLILLCCFSFNCALHDDALASDFYVLTLSNPTFPEPDLLLHLDSQFGSPVSGWSITLCHDPDGVILNDVIFASALTGLPSPPDFHDVSFFTGGFTTNCIVDNSQLVTLPPDDDHTLYLIDYSWTPSGNGYSDIEFCPTSPTGPGLDSYITSSGQSTEPFSFDTFLFNGFADPAVIYSIPRSIGSYDPQSGIGSVDLEPRISPALFGLFDVTGFSMAGSHDSSLLQVEDFMLLDDLAGIFGGSGPDLVFIDFPADGWSVEAIFGPTGMETVNFPGGISPFRITYSTVPGAIAAGSCAGSWLRFSNIFGDNDVNYLNFGSTSATLFDELAVLLPVSPTFQRGDCNGDSSRNLADAIFNLSVLFSGGGPAPCDDACDHNDDGSIDISDAVFMLTFLFSGGTPFPPPDQICGEDPTADALSCANNTCP